MKRTIFLFIIFCALSHLVPRKSDAEPLGEFPTGLLALEEKHPCYLFVPGEYSPEKPWPILVLLGERGEDPKEVIEPWVERAKKNQFLLLALPTLMPENDLPTSADQWLLEVKREVSERYRISPFHILLVGTGSGAHYAAYLGLKYPKEFSAAGLIQGAWSGPFEKLMKPSRKHEKQIPFYVAVDPEEEPSSGVEAKSGELEEKGYPITLDASGSKEDEAGIRDRMIKWFLEGSEFRAAKDEQEPPSRWGGVKALFRQMRENLFEMKN